MVALGFQALARHVVGSVNSARGSSVLWWSSDLSHWLTVLVQSQPIRENRIGVFLLVLHAYVSSQAEIAGRVLRVEASISSLAE